MPLAVYVSAQERSGSSLWASMPPQLQGGFAVTAVVVAFPLLWPAWLAIGWFEGSLAEQVGAGNERAATTAVRLLTVQGLAWATIAVIVVVAVHLVGGAVYHETALWWAWLVPSLVAAGHVSVAVVVRGPRQDRHQLGRS